MCQRASHIKVIKGQRRWSEAVEHWMQAYTGCQDRDETHPCWHANTRYTDA